MMNRRVTYLLVGLGGMAIGAAALLFVQRASDHRDHAAVPGVVAPEATPAPADAATRRLTLQPEARERAGIQTVDVAQGAGAAVRRLPGTVEPHGYRVVDVTPLVAGTVVEVRAELGQTVREGAVVARLRSPEVTDEIRRWLTLRAERDVVRQRLARTESLAQIGAASRQDLEQDQASLVRASTELETSRARLARLGVTEARLAALEDAATLPEIFDVMASASGVVLTRGVNPGQNVDAGQPVVTLADRSVVWVLADVFEADLAHTRVGQTARVTSEAFPGREWAGRLTYLDPAIARDTRTVRARIEVANADEALRFGMFVSVALDGPGGQADLIVPASAVQTIGAVQVVYVEQEAGRFEERVVRTGPVRGTLVVIESGVAPGDRVVTAGSFALRAERDRLGWPPPVPLSAAAPAPEGQPRPAAPARPDAATVLTRVVEITAAGLVPARVTVPAHQAVDLVFIRRVKDEETCGTDVAIPSLGILQDLPFNERVTIRLPPSPPGELTFSCGMDMLRGVIIVGR